jgi:hypothetical protein
MANKSCNRKEQFIQIPIDSVSLPGDLSIIEQSAGIVLFVHASGSSGYSRRHDIETRIVKLLHVKITTHN